MRMMKIAIVEDEALFLDNLQQMIRECVPEAQVKGYLFQGEATISELEQNPPDLLFCDIRMPKMDGLQLIARLKEKFEEMRFVLISGFVDFQYAKKGIQLGVKAYLSKPADKTQVQEIIKETQEYLEKEQLRKEEEYFTKAFTYADVQIPEGLQSKQLYVFQLCYGNYIESGMFSPSDGELLQEFTSFDWKRLVTNCVEGRFWLIGQELNQRCLLIPKESSNQEPRLLAHCIMSKFAALGVRRQFCICYNPVAVDPTEVKKLSLKLQNQVKYGLRAWKNIILKAGETDISEPLGVEQIQEELPDLREEPRKQIQSVVRHVVMKAYTNAGTQRSIVKSVQNLLIAIRPGYPQAYQRTLSKCADNITQIMVLATTMNEFIRAVSEMLYNVYNGENPKMGRPDADVVESVQRQFAENLALSQNIAQLASRYYITPKHLIYLFKRKLGMSPVQYLTQLRIEKAKQLLLETDLPVKDIAVCIGYPDVNYFNRIFKKYTDVPPAAFRSRISDDYNRGERYDDRSDQQ